MKPSSSADTSRGLTWPKLIPGTLLKRYKRFLADVELHIVELEKLADAGHRFVMFYFIQSMDAQVFRPADHIDPAYGRQLRRAIEKGIEALAYDVRIDMQGIELNQNILCDLQPNVAGPFDISTEIR